MAFGIDFPIFGATNPFGPGTTPYTALDTYSTAAYQNNGASQLLGSLYQQPLPQPTLAAAKGAGSNPVFRYVRYNPTASQAILTGPQLVYWKDTSFTTVTGLASEALSINLIAGWLLYNTTTLSTATAAQINGNYCWIQVGGYLPGAFVTTGTAVGGNIIGLGTTFGATGYLAPNTAPTNTVAGVVVTVAASNLSDLWVPPLY